MSLTLRNPDECPSCGSDAIFECATDEPALFKGAGYGATRRTVVATCGECDWYLTREVSEVKP